MDEKPRSMQVARRAFLKNAARIGFALPVITTFTMAGIGEASAGCRGGSGNQSQGGGSVGGSFDHEEVASGNPGKHSGVSGNQSTLAGGRSFGR